jgi:hypothetical protein
MNKNDKHHLIAAALRVIAALLRVFDRHGDCWPFW